MSEEQKQTSSNAVEEIKDQSIHAEENDKTQAPSLQANADLSQNPELLQQNADLVRLQAIQAAEASVY